MEQENVRKTSLMRAIERSHGGRDIRELIRDSYRRSGSVEAAAKELGVSRMAVLGWINHFGGRLTGDVEFPGFAEAPTATGAAA